MFVRARVPLLLALALAVLLIHAVVPSVDAKKRRITDDDPLIDPDETDEERKAWGIPTYEERMEKKRKQGGGLDINKLQKMSRKNPSDMAFAAITGSELCFVRLRPDASRSKEDVDRMASMWSGALRSGANTDTIYVLDADNVILSVDGAEQAIETKNYLFTFDEVYEFEIKGQKVRRPEDTVPHDQLEGVREAREAREAKDKAEMERLKKLAMERGEKVAGDGDAAKPKKKAKKKKTKKPEPTGEL
ncbi:unnamed protein product [Pedinophyceae sp. YPF-701]|nr:unnamed protein product [Pedinophyceae sp. YPF-701]